MFPVTNQNSSTAGTGGTVPPTRRGSVSSGRRSPTLTQSDVSLPYGGGDMAPPAPRAGSMAAAAPLASSSSAGSSGDSETVLQEAAINLLERGDTVGALELLSLLEAMSLVDLEAAGGAVGGAPGADITTSKEEWADIRRALIQSKRAYEAEQGTQQSEQSDESLFPSPGRDARAPTSSGEGVEAARASPPPPDYTPPVGRRRGPGFRRPSQASTSSAEGAEPPRSSPPPDYAPPVGRRRGPGFRRPSRAPTAAPGPMQPVQPPRHSPRTEPLSPALYGMDRREDRGFHPDTNLANLRYYHEGCRQWPICFSDPTQAKRVFGMIMEAVARNQTLDKRFLSSLLVRTTGRSERYTASLDQLPWVQSRLTLYTRDRINMAAILTRCGDIMVLPEPSARPGQDAAAEALLPPYPLDANDQLSLFNSNNLRFAARSNDDSDVVRLWFSNGVDTGTLTVQSAGGVVAAQHEYGDVLCIPFRSARDRDRFVSNTHSSDDAALGIEGVIRSANELGYSVDRSVLAGDFVAEFVMTAGVLTNTSIDWIGVDAEVLAALRQQVDDLYQRARRRSEHF